MSEGNQRNAPAGPTPPTDAPPNKPAGVTRPQPTVTKRTTPPGKPQFGSRPAVAKNPVAKNPVVRPQPHRTNASPNGVTTNGSTANGAVRPGPSTVNPGARPPAPAQPRAAAPPAATPPSARPRMTSPQPRTSPEPVEGSRGRTSPEPVEGSRGRTSPELVEGSRGRTSPEPVEGPRQRLTPPAANPAKPQASTPVKNPAAPATPVPPATSTAKTPAPAWNPPAPAPSRSWKDRLGLGKKTEPQAGLALAAPPAAPLTTSDPGRTGTTPAVPAAPAAKVGADRPGNPETTQLDPTTPPQKKVLGVPVPAMLRPGTSPQPAPTPVDSGGPRTERLPAVAAAQPAPPAVRSEPGPKPKAGTARRTRKARLRLSQVDPWSVMKTSFLFSIAAGIMLVVAVYAFWTVLSSTQLFDSVNEIVQNVVSTPGDSTPFRVQEYVNTQKVMGVAALIACVDVLIFTALATLGSFLYNLAATMLGGLEVTLAED